MKSFVLILGLSALFSSCTKDALHGAGEKKIELRNVGQFDVVHISGSREAEIIKSDKWRVELSGYANLLARFEARVENGNLRFEYPGVTNVSNDNIKIKIYAPSVLGITQSGDTRMRVWEGFSGDRMNVELSGKSRFEIGPNTFNYLRLDGSGETTIYARDAKAQKVELYLSGEAEAEVFASEILKIDASGKAKVRYWGRPQDTDFKTSGDVVLEKQ